MLNCEEDRTVGLPTDQLANGLQQYRWNWKFPAWRRADRGALAATLLNNFTSNPGIESETISIKFVNVTERFRASVRNNWMESENWSNRKGMKFSSTKGKCTHLGTNNKKIFHKCSVQLEMTREKKDFVGYTSWWQGYKLIQPQK